MVNDLTTELFFLVTKIHNEKWRIAEHCKHLLIGLGTHLFVKVPRPGDSEVTFRS